MRELNPFLLADNIRRERENYNAWLSGFYVYVGVSTALANAFRDKGQRVQNYMEKPIRITPLTEEEQLQEQQREREKAIAYFKAMEVSWKAKEDRNDGG